MPNEVMLFDFARQDRAHVTDDGTPEPKHTGQTGSLGYMARGCLDQSYDHKADVYSFAVILGDGRSHGALPGSGRPRRLR